MTKFSDQLFDDLMREHGPALTHITLPAQPKRRDTARRVLVASGGTLAVAAAIGGALEAGSASPAYAVTKNADGTTTIAVYRTSGITGANARLHQLGDKQVVVVPIEPGCPRPVPPAISGHGHRISAGIGYAPTGSITVKAQGIPPGDIMIIGVESKTVDGKHTSVGIAALTSPPAPRCISLPAVPQQ
jgi:hypothetical protein